MNWSRHPSQPGGGPNGGNHLHQNGLEDVEMSREDDFQFGLGDRTTPNYQERIHMGLSAVMDSPRAQMDSSYSGQNQLGASIFTAATPTTPPLSAVTTGHFPSHGGVNTSGITLGLCGRHLIPEQPDASSMQNIEHHHGDSRGSQFALQSQASVETPPSYGTQHVSRQPAPRRPKFIPAVITCSDEKHHIMTCSSGTELCLMSVAMAKQLKLKILVIPVKRRKPLFTPIGMVTPTHFCSFRCDIAGLGVKGREMSVSLVYSDDLRVFAYLHLSQKFHDSLRKHGIQPSCEPGRSHAARHHRRRHRGGLASSSGRVGSLGGVPRLMAIRDTMTQEQAIDDSNHLYLSVPSFSIGNSFGTPTTTSSDIFSANITSPTHGTSFPMSEWLDFGGASSVDENANN